MTATVARQLVRKLWSYCSVLRDDGLSYPDYVEQLTYLLFLKMAHEQTLLDPGASPLVPLGLDWPSLTEKRGDSLAAHYNAILGRLGTQPGMLGLIFRGAENKITDPAKLRLLVADLIDSRDWSSLDVDVKGEAYEGLLERNAQDTKSGAGQYFTPRPLVDSLVECIRPRPGEVVYDPACGTGGFLIAALLYIERRNRTLSSEERRHLRLHGLRGTELVPAVARLATMNLLLRGVGPDASATELPIDVRDALGGPPSHRCDVILSNPPFGKRSSVTVSTRKRDEAVDDDLTLARPDLWASTSNKELNFLQHVASILAEGGRAAVIVPDGVLSASGAGEIIRRHLLSEYDVHTLLRLPPGIFYAAGVNANVLFFDRPRGGRDRGADRVWVYDLRTNNRFTPVGNRLDREHLDEFLLCYNPEDRTRREATWSQSNPRGRWRAFGTQDLLARDRCSLDVFWIGSEDAVEAGGSDALDKLTSDIIEDLQAAITKLSELKL